jgi:hypothetical protein
VKLFKQLTAKEEAEYRASARANYKPLDDIKGIFHPTYQLECVLMNMESNLITSPEDDKKNSAECKQLIEKITSGEMSHQDFLSLLTSTK